MKNKVIIIILSILFIISLFFCIVSTLEHYKKDDSDTNDLVALEYKEALIDKLNDYIDNNNVDLKNGKSINVHKVLAGNICNGIINFNNKKDVIINDVNLACDYNLNITSITYNKDEKIIDLVKLENGYFLITYDEKKLDNYIIKLDEGFETEWKNKIDYTIKVDNVKYLGYHFEKSINKYYIILNVTEKGEIYSNAHTIVAMVDKNGYNFEINMINDLTIDDIYKIEIKKDTMFIYDKNCFVVGYDLKNKKTTRLEFGQNMDYNHEKLIGIDGGLYYTYEQVYKLLYKYSEPGNIVKSEDLFSKFKDYSFSLFDDLNPIMKDNKIYIKVDKDAYSSLLVFDYDFNFIKEIKLEELEYTFGNLLENKTDIEMSGNELLYVSVNEKDINIVSRVIYNDKKYIAYNVYDLEKNKFVKNNIIDFDKEKKLLNNKENEIEYYSVNKYNKRSIINVMKYENK